MNDSAWLEMPIVRTGVPDHRARPKYPVETNAFLVYRDEKVYVRFPDDYVLPSAMEEPDCRWLSSAEARRLEDGLPFPVSPPSEHHHRENEPVGLGDVISWVTHKVGIEECSGCGRRKRWLNRIPVWGWWRA
jgi:hypothetical protein